MAGQEHGDDRNGLALEFTDQIEAFGIAVMEGDIGLVSHEFGVGPFTEDDDGNIWMLRRRAIWAEQRLSASCFDLGFQAFIDGSRAVSLAHQIGLPAQPSVQPPDCMATLLAPSPATSTVAFGLIGRRLLFFRRTSDLRTASRATARCCGVPMGLEGAGAVRR